MQAFKKSNLLKSLKRTLQGVYTSLSINGLGGKRYGYYIPYPYAGEVSTPKNMYPLKSVLKILDTHTEDYKKLCAEAERFNDIFKTFSRGSKTDPLAPRFNQDWFTGLDGAFAYTLVRILKPKKIVEVGAGFSTRFLSRPTKDGGFKTELISINPKKLQACDKLCSKYYQCTLDKAPKEIFSGLEAGDILFIDASHLLMPGTDLELLFLDIIPSLKKGVYIHFHDIFLPDAYPKDKDWDWWAFNEQYYLAVLLYGGAFKPVMPAAYIKKYYPNIVKNIYAPLHPRGLESSFWLVKESDI